MGEALQNTPPKFQQDSPLAQAWQNGKGRFLIDGFPRKLDQAHKFDESVSSIRSGPETSLPADPC
jgi:adenylate kinase family enzyme